MTGYEDTYEVVLYASHTVQPIIEYLGGKKDHNTKMKENLSWVILRPMTFHTGFKKKKQTFVLALKINNCRR